MTEQRDQGGRFKPGNPGGPGRPAKEIERSFLEATITACTLADWQKIVEKAVALAKEGDGPARRWLAEYILGKPGTGAAFTKFEQQEESDREFAEIFGGFRFNRAENGIK